MSLKYKKHKALLSPSEMPAWTISEHWAELRLRVLVSLLVYIISVALCFNYADWIYSILAQPLVSAYSDVNGGAENRKLIFTGLSEGFFAYIRLSLYAGFLLAFPVIMGQTYRFIAPGLYPQERKIVKLFFMAAPLLFMSGVLLVYFMVIPLAWRFFLSFEQPSADLPIVLEARVSEYLDLSLEMMLSFGLAFQMPIVLGILGRMVMVNAAMLQSKRRHAIVVIFIVAAILTPPDVISQIALAIPLMVLYELSICIIKKMQKVN